MWRRACVLLLLAAGVAAGCSDDDDQPDAATTTAPTTTTTTTAPAVSDEAIVAAVHSASPVGAALLPDEDWADAVLAACGELPGLEDGEITTLFDLLRIQVENQGASHADSREAVVAFVGGIGAACPDLAARVVPLVPRI